MLCHILILVAEGISAFNAALVVGSEELWGNTNKIVPVTKPAVQIQRLFETHWMWHQAEVNQAAILIFETSWISYQIV